MNKLKSLIILIILSLCIIIGYNLFNLKIEKNNNLKDSSIENELRTDLNIQKSNVENTPIDNLTKTDSNISSGSSESNTLINDNRGIPVLYYHSVNPNSTNEVIITPSLLREHLSYLKNEGYISLTISDVQNYLINNKPIPEKSILITFDDGYMDNYYYAFPILKELNLNATIFCITNVLDGSYYLSEDAIKEMSDYGLDIQSHTVSHPNLDKLSYADQLNEMINSKKTLEKLTGKDVYSIAYPFGDFNSDTVKAAKEAGYTLGFTTNRGLSDRDDNPLKLDRIYVSSNYDLNAFKTIFKETKK
ncbi:MAG: polysaccharide deacetylase family protein [Clostridium butyricum]|nr:polysaccharide deacetylase family protein [Clostridium butyricum]